MAIIQGGLSGSTADVGTRNLAFGIQACDTQGAVYDRPRFGVKIYHIRITTAIAAGGVLWSFQNLSTSTKSIYIDSGFISLSLDTVTVAEVGVEMVRFIGSTPTGGTALTPFRYDLTQAGSQAPNIQFSSATAGLTTAGATIDATTQALFNLTIPFNAGANRSMDFDQMLWGLRLQAGEGLMIRTNPAAAPIGLTMGGMLGWGEE